MGKAKQAPNRVNAEELYNRSLNSCQTLRQVNGGYVPARMMGYDSIPRRLKLAWDVFRGKADALYWKGQ